VGIIIIGDGTGFNEILINSDKSDSVSTRNIRDIFDGSTHHKNGSLNGFNVEIIFFTSNIVGSHDSNFFSGFDGTREDSSESEKSRFISGGDHFRDIHHKGTVGVTSFHGFTGFIINRSFVKIFSSISLGSSRGR
jgi:hypothetical protein